MKLKPYKVNIQFSLLVNKHRNALKPYMFLTLTSSLKMMFCRKVLLKLTQRTDSKYMESYDKNV